MKRTQIIYLTNAKPYTTFSVPFSNVLMVPENILDGIPGVPLIIILTGEGVRRTFLGRPDILAKRDFFGSTKDDGVFL